MLLLCHHYSLACRPSYPLIRPSPRNTRFASSKVRSGGGMMISEGRISAGSRGFARLFTDFIRSARSLENRPDCPR